MSDDGLTKISQCENSSRRGDIVFVHGLGGNALSTWHPDKRSDDRDSWLFWLGQDLPDVGIWSLGYEAEPFAWKGTAMPLADRATNTLAVLDADGVGERPLIFIAHSLGGLLVKQMLRHASDFGDSRWKQALGNTRGIIFLSTPHSGANLANWVKHIGGLLRTTVSVDELEAHHSRLRELNLWYRNNEYLSKIPMQVYCEKNKTKGILVVDETSADPGIKGVVPIPEDENHLSICCPRSRDSLLYKRTIRFIHECLTLPISESLPYDRQSIKIGNYIAGGSTIYGNFAGRDYISH
jgi:hypothetical protein